MPTHSSSPLQLWLFLFFVSGLAITFAGHGSFVDENLIMQVVDSIAQRGSLEAMEGFQALEGPDGKWYSRYGIGFPLLMLPWYYLGEVLYWLFGASPVFFRGAHFFACLWGNLVITALTGVLFYRICRLIGGEAAPSVLLSVALIWGTPFWPYSQTLFRLTTTTALLLAMLELILRHQQTSRRAHLIGLAACVALGANLREDSIIAVACLGVFSTSIGPWRERGLRLAAMFAGGLAGVALWAWHNYVRFGVVFIENYADLQFDYPLIISLPYLLFHSSRGMVTYAPLCLLLLASFRIAFQRNHGYFWLMCLAVIIAYLLLYGKSHMWHGGRCWGPRHMYFLLPFCMAPAVWLFSTEHKRFWYALLAFAFLWGLVMNWPGVYAHTGKYQSFFTAPGFLELLSNPIGHPDYITFDDLDLWWIRMIRLHPFSLFPLAFVGLLAFAGYSGYRLWHALRNEGYCSHDA